MYGREDETQTDGRRTQSLYYTNPFAWSWLVDWSCGGPIMNVSLENPKVCYMSKTLQQRTCIQRVWRREFNFALSALSNKWTFSPAVFGDYRIASVVWMDIIIIIVLSFVALVPYLFVLRDVIVNKSSSVSHLTRVGSVFYQL